MFSSLPQIDTGAETDCIFCEGSGFVLEQHDYSQETLGCPDCEGTGRVPFSVIRDLIRSLVKERDEALETAQAYAKANMDYRDRALALEAHAEDAS